MPKTRKQALQDVEMNIETSKMISHNLSLSKTKSVLCWNFSKWEYRSIHRVLHHTNNHIVWFLVQSMLKPNSNNLTIMCKQWSNLNIWVYGWILNFLLNVMTTLLKKILKINCKNWKLWLQEFYR